MSTQNSSSPESPGKISPTQPLRYWRLRARIGLTGTLISFLIFLIGARPGLFGLDRSPVVGFVQISVFLFGLVGICVSGHIALSSLWMGQPTSIAADMGLRLISTGYVIAFFSGMADFIGIGSQTPPRMSFFGPLQAWGVEFGQAIIALGFILIIPY